MDAIPPQLQDKVLQFQELQNQLQNLIFQKHQLKQQLADIDNALEALENTKSKKVYERAGLLFIETDLKKTKEKLEDDKGLKEAQLKSLEKQESKLKDKLNELGKELQSQIGGGTGGVVAE